MRDTARARVERAHTNIEAIASTLRAGRGTPVRTIERAEEFAEVATKPIVAPEHGAEYVRSMLFFTEQLLGRRASEALAERYEAEGVIWRPVDQLRAAQKQIGRLRSDAVKAKTDTIPLTTVVYAGDEGDFVGSTYVRLDGVKLPVKDSTGPVIRLRAGKSTVPVRLAALRYVEAPMIRVR